MGDRKVLITKCAFTVIPQASLTQCANLADNSLVGVKCTIQHVNFEGVVGIMIACDYKDVKVDSTVLSLQMVNYHSIYICMYISLGRYSDFIITIIARNSIMVF